MMKSPKVNFQKALETACSVKLDHENEIACSENPIYSKSPDCGSPAKPDSPRKAIRSTGPRKTSLEALCVPHKEKVKLKEAELEMVIPADHEGTTENNMQSMVLLLKEPHIPKNLQEAIDNEKVILIPTEPHIPTHLQEATEKVVLIPTDSHIEIPIQYPDNNVVNNSYDDDFEKDEP